MVAQIVQKSLFKFRETFKFSEIFLFSDIFKFRVRVTFIFSEIFIFRDFFIFSEFSIFRDFFISKDQGPAKRTSKWRGYGTFKSTNQPPWLADKKTFYEIFLYSAKFLYSQIFFTYSKTFL